MKIMNKENDSTKLRLLADWFDMETDTGRWGKCDSAVQDDLRRIADYLEDIQNAKKTS